MPWVHLHDILLDGCFHTTIHVLDIKLMHMYLFFLAGLLLVWTGALVRSRLGFACDCVVPSVGEAFERSFAVFVGKAQGITYSNEAGYQGDPKIVVTLEVVKSWKGPTDRPLVLHTVYNRASCDGYWFEEGNTYLVYAFQNDDGSLGASLCSRTTSADTKEAKEDLAVLGALNASSTGKAP